MLDPIIFIDGLKIKVRPLIAFDCLMSIEVLQFDQRFKHYQKKHHIRSGVTFVNTNAIGGTDWEGE